jgi:hypothetical protein
VFFFITEDQNSYLALGISDSSYQGEFYLNLNIWKEDESIYVHKIPELSVTAFFVPPQELLSCRSGESCLRADGSKLHKSGVGCGQPILLIANPVHTNFLLVVKNIQIILLPHSLWLYMKKFRKFMWQFFKNTELASDLAVHRTKAFFPFLVLSWKTLESALTFHPTRGQSSSLKK